MYYYEKGIQCHHKKDLSSATIKGPIQCHHKRAYPVQQWKEHPVPPYHKKDIQCHHKKDVNVTHLMFLYNMSLKTHCKAMWSQHSLQYDKDIRDGFHKCIKYTLFRTPWCKIWDGFHKCTLLFQTHLSFKKCTYQRILKYKIAMKIQKIRLKCWNCIEIQIVCHRPHLPPENECFGLPLDKY